MGLVMLGRQVEIAIAILRCYKSPGSDQMPAELIQRGEILRSKIHKLINSIWDKEELPDQWKESIIVPIHKKVDKTDHITLASNILTTSGQYTNECCERDVIPCACFMSGITDPMLQEFSLFDVH
jgi:hypothetical protein